MHYYSYFLYEPVTAWFMSVFPFLEVAKGALLWHVANSGRKGWFITIVALAALIEIPAMMWLWTVVVPGISLSAVAPFLFAGMLWTIIIKGTALWYAGHGDQKWWFFILFVFNTMGILEIVYLTWFRPLTSDTVSSASPKIDWRKGGIVEWNKEGK